MGRVLLLIFILLIPLPALTADDQADEWPEGSAMAVGIEHRKTLNYFSDLLEKKHAKLITLLGKDIDSRLIEGLKAQHTSWQDYAKKECEVFGANSGAGGSWSSAYAIECEARITEHRFKRIRAAVACIQKIPEEKRPFEINHCLYQILPFNFKGQ